MKNSFLVKFILILLLLIILLCFIEKRDDNDLFKEQYEKGDII